MTPIDRGPEIAIHVQARDLGVRLLADHHEVFGQLGDLAADPLPIGEADGGDASLLRGVEAGGELRPEVLDGLREHGHTGLNHQRNNGRYDLANIDRGTGWPAEEVIAQHERALALVPNELFTKLGPDLARVDGGEPHWQAV